MSKPQPVYEEIKDKNERFKGRWKLIAVVGIIILAVGIAHAVFTGNVSNTFSGASFPSLAATANPPTGGTGGGSCGTITTSGQTLNCPAVSFTGAASGATYTITYTITGGASSESVTPTSTGTTGANASCPGITLNGTGSGSGTCTITPTAATGTVAIQIPF